MKIAAECRELGIVVKQVDSKKLDLICSGAVHQGVIAYAASHEYAQVEDIFSLAETRNEAPFFVVCDEIEDPHNLGAILRSAEAAGVHGIIIPKRRSVSLNFTVAKASAGAIEHVPVARVSNLAAAIDDLKKRGVWVYGADMNGSSYDKQDFSGAVALVIGSEGKGIGRLIREKCDFIVSIPMRGNLNSLNASVAAGILMFEISRQRSTVTG